MQLMNTRPLACCLLFLLLLQNATAAFQQPAPDKHPHLFVWTDTCNAYLLREGEAALMIDIGDGSVFAHLHEIGVKTVERVLLTDHHREGLQGVSKLSRPVTQVAAPKEEQAFLERPAEFRKWRPKLGDPFTVHGSSYVRPPANPVRVDRWLAEGDRVEWRGHVIECISTPGHSPGGMSYILREHGDVIAITGGVMHDGAKMSNWFDTEWDYGFAKGIDTLMATVQKMRQSMPHLILPAQGPPIREAGAQLETYSAKLKDFRADYVRGYPVQDLSKRGRHPAVKTTPVPMVVQVTPHLYMFNEEMAGKNFAILIADSGHALLLDCGLFPKLVLDRIIAEMKQHLGLKHIDACWISHMHGDHFTLAPELRDYGVKFWTMDSIADKCENPLAYDYPAMITSYNVNFEGTKIDRVLKAGEVIDWEGYKLHIDWMPGQTEFGNALWLELDGKRVVFTGDNLFGDPSDAAQDGHECVVARNSAITEEGYLVAAKYLQRLRPDIIVGAHTVLMTEPAAFVDRYHEWAERIIRRYKELLPGPDYRYLFDPYWVSAYPYRVDLSQRNVQMVQVTVRNFQDTEQKHQIELKLPHGVTAKPAILEGSVTARSRQSYQVTLTVSDRSKLAEGVQMVPFDITLDGKRYGELFDFLIRGREDSASPP
jgi:glyoxylase-like metal-dependent hydrolase (beta-lactamase superfamily II)